MLASAFEHGEVAKVIPAARLDELQDELSHFADHHELNEFQEMIVGGHRAARAPELEFEVQSIIVVAIPHPIFAYVDFIADGRAHRVRSLVMADFDATSLVLTQTLGEHGYHASRDDHLPLKRLAVHSGLACYGRNNVCYIEGLGSNFSLVAYWSDLPCVDVGWSEVRLAPTCAKCTICMTSCPTGAIRKDRFPIDTDRCLSYWNEGGAPFPEWMPASAHNCVYDCLECQLACPMNKDQLATVAGPVQFDEAETAALLGGAPIDSLPPPAQEKAHYLGMHQWPAGIARNLRALFARSAPVGND